MRSKKLTGIALLLAVLFLTGCGGSVVTDLYVQDILEVLEVVEGVKEPMLTTATITVESPGEEYQAQVAELLERTFREATNFRTLSQDFSTYIAMDVKVPILDLDDYLELGMNDDALGIVVMDMDEDGIAFGFAMNGERLDELFTTISDEFWQSVSVRDFIFTVKLISDIREPISVSLQGIYANQAPVAYEEKFDLVRRDVLEIKLGDVMRDSAYQDGLAVFGVLRY